MDTQDVGDARTMGNLPWKALSYTKRETKCVTSGRAEGEGLCKLFQAQIIPSLIEPQMPDLQLQELAFSCWF